MIHIAKTKQVNDVCWNLWFLLEAIEAKISKRSKIKSTQNDECLFLFIEELDRIQEKVKNIRETL